MVTRINGIAALKASFSLPVFPHMIPKAEKRKPESPIVASVVVIGKKLAMMAIRNAQMVCMLFLMFHRTMMFMRR